MRLPKTICVVLALVALSLGGLPAGAADPARSPDLGPLPATVTVTLVTGDQVLVGQNGSAASVRPGPGRAGIPFVRFVDEAGHLNVVPKDAARLLATDRLDPRLFDVTLLRELELDARTVPLIVAGARPAVRAATEVRAVPGFGTALTAPASQATWSALTGRHGLGGDAVSKVWLDGRHRASLDQSVPRIGAPTAWAAGYTGAGVTVAVLDTGVDQTHPDLAGREVAERVFGDASDNVDRDGHGTHVAATVAGAHGVAPDAKLLDGKVFDDNGWASESAIIAGMHWAAEQGAEIVNLSLGSSDWPGVDPVEETVNTLSASHGTLFVVAAGNTPWEPASSPASADAALAVGAVDAEDAVAEFSSRGPRAGDGAVKPEVTAPGVDITAAQPGGGHADLSGTSMAAPHVSGAAALLAQRHPEWTDRQLKAALVASAVPSPAPRTTPFDQGAGRIDVARALDQTITSDPPTVTAGLVPFPYDEPVTRPITYHNSGPADVTLDLTVDAFDQVGAPAPAGVFTLSATTVTVPAGGRAEVTVTADVARATADGGYAGTVLATGPAGATTRTPVSVLREPESYDLTIDLVGLDGELTGDYDLILVPVAGPGGGFVHDPDGRVTLRLPVGHYLLHAIFTDESGHDHAVAYPALTLTGTTTVELDARTARPITITPPDPDATSRLLDLGVAYQPAPTQVRSYTWMYDDPSQVSLAHAGPVPPGDVVTSWVNSQWTAPGDDGADEFYGLAWFQRGQVPTGFSRTVDKGRLARVDAEFVAVAPGMSGRRWATPSPLDGFDREFLGDATGYEPVEVAVPGRRTEYYNTEARWSPGLAQADADGRSVRLTSPSRHYRPGGHYRERTGAPVVGPTLPPTDYRWPGGSRTGDWISVQVPLFGDGAGNAGESSVDSARTALYRDGALVGASPYPGAGDFLVPAEPADYRLTTEATRTGFDHSSTVSAAWTFRSAHVAGEAWARVALSTVRFAPDLADDGSAPAGQPFLLPVAVVDQDGRVTPPRTLTVEVSYDDGASWRRAPVIGKVVAVLRHPSDATTVSLRASARNRDGTTVEQTIVRAYRLTGA